MKRKAKLAYMRVVDKNANIVCAVWCMKVSSALKYTHTLQNSAQTDSMMIVYLFKDVLVLVLVVVMVVIIIIVFDGLYLRRFLPLTLRRLVIVPKLKKEGNIQWLAT